MTKIIRHTNKDGQETNSIVILGARTSYMAVFRPRYNELKKADEFTCDLIFEKGADLSAFNAVIKDVCAAKWGNRVPQFKYPHLRSGNDNKNTDGEIKEGYQDNQYIVAKAQADRPPAVVDRAKKAITNASDFQSGDYCNAFINVYAYDKGANKGIGFDLVTIQKTADGESFTGGISKSAATDALAEYDGEEDVI